MYQTRTPFVKVELSYTMVSNCYNVYKLITLAYVITVYMNMYISLERNIVCLVRWSQKQISKMHPTYCILVLRKTSRVQIFSLSLCPTGLCAIFDTIRSYLGLVCWWRLTSKHKLYLATNKLVHIICCKAQHIDYDKLFIIVLNNLSLVPHK